MEISVELVGKVLLGTLTLSAPSVMSFALFRVLVKDGVPLDSQRFRQNHSVLSLISWPMMFLPGLFGIFTIGNIDNTAMPDRWRAASIMCAGTLILVFSWFFFMLVLRRKLWATRPDFTKAFPFHFFYLFHILPLTWTVLLLYHLRDFIEKVFG